MDETESDARAPAPPPAPEPVGRREFLANALRLGGGVLVFLSGAPALGEDHVAEGYDWTQHRYAYLIDTEKCIGCGSCVRACKAENGVPDGFFRTWVERYVVSPEASHVDSPKGGLDGFPPIQTPFTPTKSFFVPKMCNHCKETPCVQVCPVGASYRTQDGLVLVDAERCIGCGYCVQACPYGSRFLSPTTHTAEKCTWCYHRVTKGLKPACVEVCPTATRQFGDMRREDDPVRLAIAHGRVSVLQPHLLTEPQCFYLGLDKEVR
ncbi:MULTISPECIES: 4Fe-4S dicluster domain-containing protein [Anaeromyxobacter]|uniref:4Fe-4S dicluster domain-containing protein n=1 Tax=Anaeromyxobacter TaxID=161492 RepID=UPI001F56FBDF|nr:MULTISPECIES: 4Fe-4S dicluster domain-containing protein [unclassified Anaeromyxobacter]